MDTCTKWSNISTLNCNIDSAGVGVLRQFDGNQWYFFNYSISIRNPTKCSYCGPYDGRGLRDRGVSLTRLWPVMTNHKNGFFFKFMKMKPLVFEVTKSKNITIQFMRHDGTYFILQVCKSHYSLHLHAMCLLRGICPKFQKSTIKVLKWQ